MFKFPYTNLHELNLDWILDKVKTLVANNDEFNEKADYAVETADEAKTIAEQAAQATIADGSITTNKLANGAVTGNKIAQATIQTGNLSAGCVTTPYILDGAVTTVKIDDGAVNFDKLASNAKLKRGGKSITFDTPVSVASNAVATPLSSVNMITDYNLPNTTVLVVCGAADVNTVVKTRETTIPTSYSVSFRNITSSSTSITSVNLWYLYY